MAPTTRRGMTPQVAPPKPWLEWPLVMVLLAAGTGVAIISTGHWRRGSFVFGAAVVGAAGLRAVLPPRLAGLLVVRKRWFDVFVTLVSGVAIMVLALIVPSQH